MNLSKRHQDSDRPVFIKPLAYYKMLVHILRFGNRVRDQRQYREVMGILIGRVAGDPNKKGIKNVIVEDAVPISHGGSIEVAFAPEDYVSFALIDEAYADKGLFSVGWFHSHPGLNIFFSGVDKINQLGWQTPNPSAIGIVFDHTFLENPGDLGFRTFRLDDPSKGQKSDYHEVETIVEPPDSIDYYFKIMELINCIHSKEPPILEINETPDLFGEIFFPSKRELLAAKPALKLEDILSALHNGISQFLQLSIEPLINFLNSWSQEIIKNIMENNIQIRDDLVDLKDDLRKGIDKLQNNFKFSLKYKLDDLETYIGDRFENFDKNNEDIKNFIEKLKEELPTQINELFEQKVNGLLNKISENFTENSNKLTEINQKNKFYSENLAQQKLSLEKLSEKTKSLERLTSENLRGFCEKIENNLKEKIANILNKFTDLRKETQEFLSNFDSSSSQIETSFHSLNDKLKEMESQKKDLLNKIKNLEEGGE